jgi:hypothetical protein
VTLPLVIDGSSDMIIGNVWLLNHLRVRNYDLFKDMKSREYENVIPIKSTGYQFVSTNAFFYWCVDKTKRSA